ncbi:MAG: stress response translation initiation inhibitor YciH [Candidatus Marsarchaeota archaeon]|jgi:translation initiation factor 1|nr:stress response translation initiation inhibitor YciH [Candidatus Marsarchaeota archaeon]
MSDTCPKCGLPTELCVCKVLDRETESKIRIYTKKAKFKKFLTVVEGIDPGTVERTTKELKRALACGGTIKDGLIELQGEHKAATKRILVNLGYKNENIDIA